MSGPISILFLCTGNSCRSQMAEAWAGKLPGGPVEASSAGVEPKGVDPRSVRVMAEAGVDISGQGSKAIEDLDRTEFDYVVTLCDHANESCPFFPGRTTRVHKSFDDPPALAKEAENEEEALFHYRRVRDEIRDWVAGFPGNLAE